MAKKSKEAQPKAKNQKVSISAEEKKEMIKISKSLGIQTTFNTDPMSELVADGKIENAVYNKN